mmetsp:Transcript_25262/g.77898  ORF Transcript_25262/g.77898 Transcript_25262/m.77898 type:complete len:224 (+) Transcript_25262:51-722(+)
MLPRDESRRASGENGLASWPSQSMDELWRLRRRGLSGASTAMWRCDRPETRPSVLSHVAVAVTMAACWSAAEMVRSPSARGNVWTPYAPKPAWLPPSISTTLDPAGIHCLAISPFSLVSMPSQDPRTCSTVSGVSRSGSGCRRYDAWRQRPATVAPPRSRPRRSAAAGPPIEWPPTAHTLTCLSRSIAASARHRAPNGAMRSGDLRTTTVARAAIAISWHIGA